MVIIRIPPINRIQIPRRQRPLDIRRPQHRQVLPVLGPKAIHFTPRREGIVPPDAVAVVVEREAVLRRVDQGPLGGGPFVEPFFWAEVAEARVGGCFGGEGESAGEEEGEEVLHFACPSPWFLDGL